MTSFTEHDPRFVSTPNLSVGVGPSPSAGFTDRRAIPLAASGFGLASLFGLGIGIISIVALDGYAPRIWASIAVIAVGAVLLLEGSGLGMRFYRGKDFSDTARRILGNGALGVEVIAGFAVAVLGILALLNVSPWLLMEIAAIAFGAAYVLSSGGAYHFGLLAGPARRVDDVSLRALVATYASARPIAGMAAVILGILALTQVGAGHEPTFVLVALLCVGSAALLGGLALGGGVARRSLV